MCGGGGSSPQAPDPMVQAEADIRRLQEEYRIRQQEASVAREMAMQDEAQERKDFDLALGGNRANARENINRQFDRRGVAISPEYDDQIIAALDLAQQGMTFNTGRNTFDSNLGSTILDDIRGAQVRDYQGAINEFAPEGFTKNAFTSTSDDAVIDAILAEQFGEASDSVLRARDRGTLNDQGFDYAMSNLDMQRKAANSRLQDTGGGILEGYRGQLGNLADTARTSAGNFDFGDTFDPNFYRDQIESTQGELGGRLEGDIRNAIGGEQFFNVADLIQKGGVGQGAQNTGLGAQSGGLLAAFSDRNKKEAQQRGLGTQGSF